MTKKKYVPAFIEFSDGTKVEIPSVEMEPKKFKRLINKIANQIFDDKNDKPISNAATKKSRS